MLAPEHVHIEYWLIQPEGEGKFGPFYTVAGAFDCVVKEELSDYELKTFLSHIPF